MFLAVFEEGRSVFLMFFLFFFRALAATVWKGCYFPRVSLFQNLIFELRALVQGFDMMSDLRTKCYY